MMLPDPQPEHTSNPPMPNHTTENSQGRETIKLFTFPIKQHLKPFHKCTKYMIDKDKSITTSKKRPGKLENKRV